MSSANIIGLGYIGMPLAAMLAQHGVRVHGVDTNPLVIATIIEGRVADNEPELAGLVARAVSSGLLTASASPIESDVFVIAVPTPTRDNAEPDISHVIAACESIAPVLRSGNLIIIESTCPVGTTESLVTMLHRLRPDLRAPLPDETSDLFVAYCPERVLPGNIVVEMRNNDRIVGGISPECARKASTFYKQFVAGHCLETNARTAELSKLVENAYRDVNVAFANEISMVCDQLGVDAWKLIDLVNHHPRVNVLKPGPGVGGHCIAVDPWFIVHAAPNESHLIRTAREVNMRKTMYVIEQVRSCIGKFRHQHGRPATIACLGVTYKANVDDIRTSPALEIARTLSTASSMVLTVDPYVSKSDALLTELNDLRFTPLDDALNRADIIVLLVDHAEFLVIPPSAFAGKELIDTRGVFPGVGLITENTSLKLNA